MAVFSELSAGCFLSPTDNEPTPENEYNLIEMCKEVFSPLANTSKHLESEIYQLEST